MSSLSDLRRRAADAIQNGDAPSAIADLQIALAREPSSLDLRLELGRAQLAASRPADAMTSFEQALTIRARDPGAHRGLALAHLALGDHAQALAAFRTALAILPYDKYAAHMVAALSGEPGSASASYVADLFDTYANDFDAHLTGNLGYNTPFLIADLLRPHAPASLLDLGCGTGLVAAAVSETISIIDGVDIAPQMIRKARERDIYRHLRAADFIATLANDPDFAGPYDAIAAADVLVYLGALEATFAAVTARLAPRGLFALSIEVSTGEEIALLASGRYAHSPGYIEGLAAIHGLAILEQLSTAIRHERSQPIPGMLYLLQAR